MLLNESVSYHRAAVVEVVLVLMSVGAEVHAGGDSRKRAAFLQTQPAVWSFGLCLALEDEDRGQLCVCKQLQRPWMETNLVAVGLRGQLLVQRSHVGRQSLESILDFVLLSSRNRSHPSGTETL